MDERNSDDAQKGKREAPPLGQAIRHRRKTLGKTLVEVATEADLTTGFISQVERGISSPSLSSLRSIAAALHTSIEQLLSVPEQYSEFIARDKRQTFFLGVERRFYEKLGPGFAGSLFHPSIIHRPAGHESEHMHDKGEAFFYLMSGQVEYHLDGAVYVMNPGDCIHHDTSKPHYSRVLGDQEAVELWVTTSPMRNPPKNS
ncbi:MAG: XRE family transcriptional regulator [Albidovulum sp.]|uniref:helix-turn-helix domain-containing protein n=1 Tax=Albidovulum sp. TaxID=1872424 RepID=UPI003CBC2528